jgi:hypothetical protein
MKAAVLGRDADDYPRNLARVPWMHAVIGSWRFENSTRAISPHPSQMPTPASAAVRAIPQACAMKPLQVSPIMLHPADSVRITHGFASLALQAKVFCARTRGGCVKPARVTQAIRFLRSARGHRPHCATFSTCQK